MSKTAAKNQHTGMATGLAVFMLAFLLFLPLVTSPTAALAQTAAPSISNSGSAALVGNRASQTQIDANIPADAGVERMLEPYSARVRALDVVIGKLEGGLRKSRIGAGTLGNFVTDGVRAQASKLGRPVAVVIVNSGGLRKNTIAEGDLRASDIFELLPFENELVEINLSGEQLMKLLDVVLAERDAQSGARLKYQVAQDNRLQLLCASLVSVGGKERMINLKKRYSVVTIDYLVQREGRYAILQAGRIKRLDVTIRDSLMEYVKSETAAGRIVQAKLDGRFASMGHASEGKEP